MILGDDAPGFRLIRGAAGSGKTTVALMRLRQLCASRARRHRRLGIVEPIRVLVFTFNTTLRSYVEYLANRQVDSEAIDLRVETFSRWALGLCDPGLVLLDNQRSLIRDKLQESGINRELEYFTDEIEYVLGRYLPENRNSYQRATRDGRGRSPQVTQRIRSKLTEDVIPSYELEKEKRQQVDWNDIAIKATTIQSLEYDVVVVDEAQDLSANQIRAIIAHLRTDHTTTFIMDTVQRIYPQAFRWREIEIDFRPHMVYTLKQNHRNSGAIARFASAVVQGMPEEENGVLPTPESCAKEGEMPKVIAGLYSSQIEYMLDYIQPFLKNEETVAFLKMRGGRWFDFIRTKLQENDIEYCELTRSSVWPTGSECVALSTIHSAKGLEFDHVLLPGLNQEVTPHGLEEGDGTLEALRRLLAVGIGRARKTVLIGYKPGEQSRLIEFFGQSTHDFVDLT